jgi:hypothetical protein
MKFRVVVLLFVALVCTNSKLGHTQQSDIQSWTMITSNISLDSKKQWFAYMEVQPRVADDVSRMERILIRPALAYNLSPTVAAFLGYAWTPTFVNPAYDSDFRNENRVWQQILIKKPLLGIDWQHRVRQEQRIIDDAASTSHRTRYLLRGSIPIAEDKSWGVTGYNELFVTLNSVRRGPRAGLDRNRFFVGPFFVQGPARFEIGYLGEYGKRFGNDERMISAFLVAMNVTM